MRTRASRGIAAVHTYNHKPPVDPVVPRGVASVCRCGRRGGRVPPVF